MADTTWPPVRRHILAARTLLAVCAAAFMGPPTHAHPVPRSVHDRTVEIRPTAEALIVRMRLEVDEFTVVYEDLFNLLDDAERGRLTSRGDFHAAFLKAVAPFLADNLIATLDDKPLAFRCTESRLEILDHLRCEFVFRADWSLPPGRDAVLNFREGNYEHKAGKIDLSLIGDGGVAIDRPTVADAALKARPKFDGKPGDEERLRTVAASLRLDANPAPAQAPILTTPEPATPADSSLLRTLDGTQGLFMILALAAVAGAAHALTPGHGKTIAAAYLVGERGTIGHALWLGFVTTVTHTGVVLAVAAWLYYCYRDADPARLNVALGFISGLIVAGLGVWLLLRRLAGQADHVHLFGDHHHHHGPDGHHHHHHSPDGRAGWVRTTLMGIGGGMVPCSDAILLLGYFWSARRPWLALPALVAFSAGLASVLVAIGVAVVYAKGKVGARWAESRLWKMLPIGSALALIVLGLWLCRDSLPATGG